MKTFSRTPIFVAVSLAALVAAPVSYGFQEQGTNEVELSGGFTHVSDSDVGTVYADVAYGYFIAPRIDLGLRQTLTYNFVDEGSDTWIASTIPFINYNFETANPNLRPFLGAFVGAAYNNDDTTGIAGPAVGVKYFLTDSTAVVARYRYEWFFDDVTFKDATDTSDGSHVFTVGLSYNW
jgi:hypothetical protein